MKMPNIESNIVIIVAIVFFIAIRDLFSDGYEHPFATHASRSRILICNSPHSLPYPFDKRINFYHEFHEPTANGTNDFRLKNL